MKNIKPKLEKKSPINKLSSKNIRRFRPSVIYYSIFVILIPYFLRIRIIKKEIEFRAKRKNLLRLVMVFMT